MSSRALAGSILVVLLSMSACGGDPPDKELQQAQTAIDAAKSAGAERYAADEFHAAEEALKNAHVAVDQRDYRQALNQALDSRERADTAAKQAIENKAAMQSNADHAISSATMALTAATTRMKAAEAAHVAARTLTDQKSAMAGAEQQLQEARAAFQATDYQKALSGAASASQALNGIVDALDTALGPPSRRKR